MDFRYRFLTLGIPWTQSMPSRDVNVVTRLAEASWRRDKCRDHPWVRQIIAAYIEFWARINH